MTVTKIHVPEQAGLHADRPNRPEGESVLPAVAVLFVALVWIPAAVMATFLLVKVSPWWIPSMVAVAALVSVLSYFLFREIPIRRTLRTSALILGLVLGAGIACAYFYDTMHDSRGYHSDAILALLNNINPLYNHIPAIRPLNANHFPKATWYFASFVDHFASNYQIGKIYNLLLMFGCFAYAKHFLQSRGVRDGYSTVLAIVIAASPVAGSQVFTYYVDGALGALLVLAVMAGVNVVYTPGRYDRGLLFMAATLAIAIKFTSLVYVAVILGGVAVVGLAVRRHKGGMWRALLADSILAVAVFIVGVLLLGYDPYITNMRQGLGPLYPVVLNGKAANYVDSDTPPGLKARSTNRVGQFLISFLGRTQTFDNAPVQLKIPFTANRREIMNMGAPDSAIAGWGVFFSGATLAALALFIVVKAWKNNEPIMMALGLVLVTAFISPLCWCARFTPQLSIIPILLLAAAVKSARGRYVTFAAQGICAFLVLNIFIAVAAGSGASFVRSRQLDRSLAAVRNAGGPGEYWAYRDPKSHEHYEQFSGYQGIRICGQMEPPHEPLPDGGFPLSINARNQTEVTLFKRSCAAGPPFPGSRQTDLD